MSKIIDMPAPGDGGEKKPARTREKIRAGVLVRRGERKAAEFEAGAVMVPEFDCEALAVKLDLWWLNGSGRYFRRDPGAVVGRDEYIEMGVSDLTSMLRGMGLRERQQMANAPLQQMEIFLNWVREHRVIDAQMRIAGFDAGMHLMEGQRVLVRSGAVFIEPVEGEWPTLGRLFEGMFQRKLEDGRMPRGFLSYLDSDKRWEAVGGSRAKARAVWGLLARELEGDRGWVLAQELIFFTWLRMRMDVYTTFREKGAAFERNTQMLIMAGSRDAGKGLLQNIILRCLLGGRMGNPAGVLFGRTDFNSDLFGAELLSMEEMPGSTKKEDRTSFAEQIKALQTAPDHRLHGKGKDAILLKPRWTWVVSLNDHPDKLMALPKLTDDLADKIHLLHLETQVMPFDTSSNEAYGAFGARLRGELPAFLYWLMNKFEIPAELKHGRFGMLSFLAPELVEVLFDNTQEGSLLDLIDEARWSESDDGDTLWRRDREVPEGWWSAVRRKVPGMEEMHEDGLRERCWVGSAAELQKVLTLTHCTMCKQAEDMFAHNRVANLLSALAKDQQERVVHARTGAAKFWVIISKKMDGDE